MESLRYRKARTEDMEAVMALQTTVFHGEQLIPRDAVEAFLAMEPQCWVAELDGVIVGALLPPGMKADSSIGAGSS